MSREIGKLSFLFPRVQQEQAPAKTLSQSRPPTSSGPYNSSSTGTEIPSGPYSGVNTGDQMDSYIENHMEESQQLADSLKQELRILTQVHNICIT